MGIIKVPFAWKMHVDMAQSDGSSLRRLFNLGRGLAAWRGPEVKICDSKIWRVLTCNGSRSIVFKCCMRCSVRFFVISLLCTVLIYIKVGLAGFQIYCLSLVTVVTAV